MTDNSNPTYPAGWYPDANMPGTERYYDGIAWTAQSRPLPAPSTSAVTVVDDAPVKRPWYKRKPIIIPVAIVGGIIVLSSIISAINGGGEPEPVADDKPISQTEEETAAAVDVAVPDTTGLTAKEAQALIENAGLEVEFSAAEGVVLDRDNWTVLSTTPAAGETAKTGSTVVVNVEKIAPPAPAAPAEPEKPAMTTAQDSAVRSAQSYLEFKGFSRAGLIGQLTSEYGEGFAPEDAEFAVAYLEQSGQVDWNQEAVQAAQSYLDFKGFSHDGLYDQLTSEYGEQFTADQANFALAQVGL